MSRRKELYARLVGNVNSSDLRYQIEESRWNDMVATENNLPMSQDDLCRFREPPRYMASFVPHRFMGLSTAAVQVLNQEIDEILSNIMTILQTEDECIAGPSSLPATISGVTKQIQFNGNEIEVRSCRVSELTAEINEEQAKLERNVGRALRLLPPLLERSRSAGNELAAATIEASLIRMSLIRAETEHKLYKVRPGDPKSPSMEKAIATVYSRLRVQEKELAKEDSALGAQLQLYQDLIQIVDGGRQGGYQQVIDDWVRVKRETEECKQDLRRLGWSGNPDE